MSFQTRLFWLFLLALTILVTTACSPDNDKQPPMTTADDPSAASTKIKQPEPEDETHELAGTTWRLVKIMGMDDSLDAPEDRTLYTLAFGRDGRATVLADCNQGAGSWVSESSSQLQFGPIAATLAMCPEGSLSDKYLTQFQWVRSYVLKDGHLFLATMADGSIIEFEPTNEAVN